MKSKIERLNGNYYLTIEYKYSVEEPFQWFSTTEGFSKWFEELHIDNDKLVFLMDDFREEMDILSFIENKSVSYQWDQAKITFTVKSNSIYFEEVIPVDYKNEFADSKKDMTGWCIHQERLSYLMNEKEAPEIEDIFNKWEAWVEKEVEEN